MTFSMMASLIAASLCQLATGKGSFRGTPAFDVKQAEAALLAELQGGRGRNATAARLLELEATLRPTYDALPKSPDGRLEHTVARYALHRLFMASKGWFVRGLEPASDPEQRQKPASATDFVKEKMPTHLQEFLERFFSSQGLNLHELTVLALTIEDLVHGEERERLEAAYRALEAAPEDRLGEEDMEFLIDTYMAIFYVEGQVTLRNKKEAKRALAQLARKSAGWRKIVRWLDDVRGLHQPAADGKTDFFQASQTIEDIGARYALFNNLECKGLKKTLTDMEDKRKAGRVRLPDFYRRGLYSEWSLDEREDYLRALGALDESEPGQPRVIVPNYVASFSNCLKVSGFYAACCPNECEDLLAALERGLAAPSAVPESIIEVVEGISSDSVKAPRKLGQPLRKRLYEVAQHHAGRVPLHGRLFAQWMHHAFPRECPFPHEAGTVNPQTPDEWMAATGHEDTSATEEERMRQADSATCGIDDINKPGCVTVEPGEDELQWSSSEELLVSHLATQQAVAASSNARRLCIFFGLLTSAVFGFWRRSRTSRKLGNVGIIGGRL